MVKLNHHYAKLSGGYLFQEVARKAATFRERNPEASIINLGIGDITRPLPPTIVQALESASREMGSLETFKGYAPSQGYLFLREAIAAVAAALLAGHDAMLVAGFAGQRPEDQA